MNKNELVLIACLGKSDPYTINKDTCRTGPVLSLVLNFEPSYIIFFASKDIELENRLKITERVISDWYQSRKKSIPVFEIIRIDEDKETFNYQETLKKVINELRNRLAKFQTNSEFIFSKTSGTPQYKVALEIFPNLYMEGFNFQIITKDDIGKTSSSPNSAATLDTERFSSSEILASIIDESSTIKEEIKATMFNHNEFASQTIFSKLQILKHLISAHEYNAAISILISMFPFLTLDRNAAPEKNWLNDIYDKDTLKQVYKSLMLAKNLLAFEQSITEKNRVEAERFIDPLKDTFDRYRLNPQGAKAELAFLNFQIFKSKSLSKEMLLSFSILLERLRKNDIKEYADAENLFSLNDNEGIKEDSVSVEFHSYFYDFYHNRHDYTEISESTALKLNSEDKLKALSMPVLEAAANYLYELKGIETKTFKFYKALRTDQQLLKRYKALKELRDKLAHDCYPVSKEDIINLEAIETLVTGLYPAISLNNSIYNRIHEFIFSKMFALNKVV